VLKGLIKSELEAEQPQKRLAAIKKLKNPKPDEQTILHRLLQSDPDPIRLAAVGKISDLEFLSKQLTDGAAQLSGDLNELFTGDSLLAHTARRMSDLLDSDCSKQTVEKLLGSSSPAVSSSIACSSVDEQLRSSAVKSIADESTLTVIATHARTHSTRLEAARKLTTPEAQEACLLQIKNRDKVVARHLQSALAERTAEHEKEKLYQASQKRLIAAMANLSESAWSPQYVGQFAALEQSWKALEPAPVEDALKQYSQAREKANTKVEQFRAQQNSLEELQGISESAESALERLTSAKLASLESDYKAAEENYRELPQRWQQTLAQLNSSVDNPFTAEYDEATGALQQLLPAVKDLLAASVHTLARRKKVTEDSAADKKPVASETEKPSPDSPQNESETSLISTSEAPAENVSAESAVTKTEQQDTARKATKDSRPVLSSQQRSAIEVVLKNDLFVSQMACVSQLRTQLGELDERVEKERQEEAQLADGIRRQLNALASAISAGKWSPAEGMSQRIARKLERLQGKQLQPLKARYEKQRFKLDELADWQDFAARPKLEELIGEMRALPASGQKPRDLANEIKSLQVRWKDLGSSRVANELWDDFKTASDTAYEPCKIYFDELKKQRDARQKNREGVCDRLQQLHDSAIGSDAGEGEELNPRELERTIQQARREWQNNRISGRKQNKSLEDRFEKLCTSLEDLLAPAYEKGATERRDLIEKARKLAEGELSQPAINQAKSLQATWKNCGPTRHVDRAREIIKTIRQLSRNANDKDESTVNELQEEFRGLADFPEKLKRSLPKDFRAACDSFSNARANQGRKQQVTEMASMHELCRLCEQIERGDIEWHEPVIKEGQQDEKAEKSEDNSKQKNEENTAATVETDGDVSEADVQEQVEADSQQQDTGVKKTEEKTAQSTAPVTAGGEAQSSELWDSFASSVPKPWLKRISQRRDNAIACIKKGDSPFNEEQDKERRMQCIRLEIISDAETPAEDKAMRMQYQLEQLQAGPDSALLGGDANSLREHEIDWLCLPPASPAIAASLEQRFRKALGQG